jgi:hypothetical protein
MPADNIKIEIPYVYAVLSDTGLSGVRTTNQPETKR